MSVYLKKSNYGDTGQVKSQKICSLCKSDMGVVFNQTRFCKTCRAKRLAEQRDVYDKRRREGLYKRRCGKGVRSEAYEYVSPSPCHLSVDGKMRPCMNTDLCTSGKLACRSYWKYFRHLPYLDEVRNPNKGYYNVTASDDYEPVRRAEVVRLLGIIPATFHLSEYLKCDSFLNKQERLRAMTTLEMVGLIKWVSGGYSGKEHILPRRERNDGPALVYLNVADENPEKLRMFLEEGSQ